MPNRRDHVRRDNSGGICPTSRGTWAAVAVLAIALPVFCFSYFAFGHSAHPKAPPTLLLASVLFRHGDRTPTYFYPNDPYKDLSNWPEGLGALTNKGKREAYKLGKWLRQRYSDLVPELYSPDDIYLMSSDHDRCLMSAQLCLAGFYPPTSNQIWNDELLWQPVPVHTIPRNLDQLIVVGKPCPRYDQELARVRNQMEISEEEKILFLYLTENSGDPVQNILAAENLHGTLEIEDKRGLVLPSWTETVYPEPLKTIAARSLATFTATDLLKRLKGGPLLKTMVTNMADKLIRKLTPDRSLFLYSGHDLTLVNLLSTLGAPGLFKPDPAAALLIELHRAPDGSQHTVEVLYLNNTDTAEAVPLDLLGCPRPCALSTFITSTNHLVPDDWDRECHQ